MRNFLRHLRAAWLFGRFFPYVEEADGEKFWTPADEQATANFFSSYTGAKFLIRLKNYATNLALDAVKQPDQPQYRNGCAAGVSMSVAAIESHFPPKESIAPEIMADEETATFIARNAT